MATPSDNSVNLTGNALIDGLVQGSKWNFSGTPVLTYSFNSTGYEYASWTLADKQASSQGLATWSAVAHISFSLQQSGTTVVNSSADLSFGLAGQYFDAYLPDVAGVGIFPSPSGADQLLSDLESDRSTYAKPEGDIFLNDSIDGSDSWWFQTGLHELGHAIGLKHPHDDGRNSRPTFAELGISGYDSARYTVMSYNVDPQGAYAVTPMILDILAIQHIYGANMNYHTGNDTYTLTDNGTLRTIWDAGGTDTISAAQLGFGITLSLRAGQLISHSQSHGSATGIAYNVAIENAIGTAYNDTILGNATNNVLDGGAGIDMATYAGGRSAFTITHNSNGTFTVKDNMGTEGTDTLTNVERLQFYDKNVALDIDGSAGTTAKILGAVFGKDSVANKEYVGIGLGLLDGGMSYGALMKLAIDFNLGAGASNAAVVSLLYTNVVSTAPPAGDLDHFVGLLNSGAYTVASLGVLAADTTLNSGNINLVGLASTGLEYL